VTAGRCDHGSIESQRLGKEEAGSRLEEAGRSKKRRSRKKVGREETGVAGAGTRGKGTRKVKEPYPPRREEKFRFCRYPYRRVWREETVG
jgi:hypothetical protein